MADSLRRSSVAQRQDVDAIDHRQRPCTSAEAPFGFVAAALVGVWLMLTVLRGKYH